jgi:RHS repeat-associated protein
LQGAGGVGGLIATTHHTYDPTPQTSTYFVAYDGNGNVMGLVDAADGGVVAEYDYDPWGREKIELGGSIQSSFTYNTRFFDAIQSLYYYGLRYFDSDNSMWLSRDPQGEKEALGLYSFVSNNPVLFADVLGERGFTPGGWPYSPLAPVPWPTPTTQHPGTYSPSDAYDDLAVVRGVILAWRGNGWKFAPRLADLSLNGSKDRRFAENDEIEALRTHSSFTDKFSREYVTQNICTRYPAGVSDYHDVVRDDVRYGKHQWLVGQTAGALFADVGSAYGQVGYEIQLRFTDHGKSVNASFFGADTYNFDPDTALLPSGADPIAAFDRLQKHGWANVYDSEIYFEVNWCCP